MNALQLSNEIWKEQNVLEKLSLFYCRKDIGSTVKQLAYTDSDTPVNTLTYTDIKINPKLDPERFKFVAPEGVTVMDRTGD